MKALVLAETIDGQRALCAGARSIADEVVLAVVKVLLRRASLTRHTISNFRQASRSRTLLLA